MATLDELDVRLRILERDFDTVKSDVNTYNGKVHNLGTRVDSVEYALTDHRNRILSLEATTENHEERLKLIEESEVKYQVVRDVNYPKKATQGFFMYMPNDITIDIFMEYNSGVIKQKWNWLNKIFNPQGYGKVSFDLDRNEKGHIKSLVLGQNTRVLIPSGIIFQDVLPKKSVLKVANESANSINKGLVYGIEILEENEEAFISIFNPTSETIIIKAGDILVQVLHLFSYHTIPSKVL